MKVELYKPLSIHELGKRANQEDSIYPIGGDATEQDRLFVLCDGMGGHEHGEVASRSVCNSLSEYVMRQASVADGIDDHLLADALSYAYEELDRLAVAGDTRQMGTTLTLLYFGGHGCTAAHIGDSRIYHLRPSTHAILYKSRDHSLAYDLYQAGELSYDEMRTFPQKNIITRAMIASDKSHPKADIVHITDIMPGDYFYICSDGMLEQMEDEELLRIFSSDKSDEEKRALLIAATTENRDNHSAYIVHIKEVTHDEGDVNLVNEEPMAKCNAVNIKPDVAEVKQTADVEIVGDMPNKASDVNTLPPSSGYKADVTHKRRKAKWTWLIALVALIVVSVGGMLGYTYFSKHATEKEKTSGSLRTDSIKHCRKPKPHSPKTGKSAAKNDNHDTIKLNEVAAKLKDSTTEKTTKRNQK